MTAKEKTYYRPSKILIEESIKENPFTIRVLDQFLDVHKEMVSDADAVVREAQAAADKKSWQGTMLLARQRGPFLRLCPGTPKHICCFYHNLDVAAGCDIDCSYCILQGYLNNPLITLYCNLQEMYEELDAKLSRYPDQFYRIGTGELSDSLTFDHFTELAPDLVRYFADKRNAIIELKTKSIHIEHLAGLAHNRRTVVSWSLNAEAVARTEEDLAPSVDERLAAAREMQEQGYWLGFHFDPMIEHENWQEGYREIVDKIFSFARPENIAWISLGALRYPPALDEIIRENHPESKIVLGELLPGVDRKLRYFKPIRVEMFRKMYQWIRSYSEDVPVYLCMESDEVWRKAFGWSPASSAALKKYLDDRVRG